MTKIKKKNIHSLLIFNINHKLIYPDLEYDYEHLGYQEAMYSSGSLQNQLIKHIKKKKKMVTDLEEKGVTTTEKGY